MDPHTEAEYRRYTAVLRENKKGYAISNSKRPRGKVTIEVYGTKLTLKCEIKNLRPHLNNIVRSGYAVWLVSREEYRGFPVYAGEISINEGGSGEANWEFNASNIKGTGLDIDSFDILEVRTCLARKDIPGDNVLSGHLELEEVNLPEEPKMEKVSPFGAGLPYYRWWKFYPGYFHDWMYYPAESENDLPGQLAETTCQDYSPDQQTRLQTAPVFQGHQLVGLQYDHSGAVKFLVNGIPGRFCLRDQPYGGATGYIYWHPLPGQKYRAGDYGYWLIHIDPKTGEVVFPKKATVPPDCSTCKRDNKD